MGCLGLIVAGLLTLAVPASIAPASLVGAYVVIGLLAVAACALLLLRSRGRPVVEGARTLTARFVLVGIAAVGYVGVVTAIHAAS